MKTKYYDKLFLIVIDIWFHNSTFSIGHNKEHIFEELDKDNDKMITPYEFDKDLKMTDFQ